MRDYANYDGLGLAELVRKREVTPAELLDAAIERIGMVGIGVGRVLAGAAELPALEVELHVHDEAAQSARPL